MGDVLSSWKEIAAYFGKGVRTVQRWEHELGLPIHRPNHADKGVVLAYPRELTDWMSRTSQSKRDLVEKQSGFNYRILVVDDEPVVRDTSSIILREQGYEIRTAADGFAALMELRRAAPDVIISDLKMPNMNGFELLSVVRRRFPHIPVIAISGEFNGIAPEGLICDAFFSKGEYRIDELFRKIADLIEASPLRPQISKPKKAPVWVPRNAEGYFVVTCPECLRSSPVSTQEAEPPYRTTCLFCNETFYFLSSSRH
ncbi:MAG TPA: response regulator [Terriglobales bacterium]|nr:response regulator [Terriglobales bacterium]